MHSSLLGKNCDVSPACTKLTGQTTVNSSISLYNPSQFEVLAAPATVPFDNYQTVLPSEYQQPLKISAYKDSDENIDTSTRQAPKAPGAQLCDRVLRGASVTVCVLVRAQTIRDVYLVSAFRWKTVKCSVTPLWWDQTRKQHLVGPTAGHKCATSQFATYTRKQI